ncbi:hypothetical protein BVG19_g459 [[Candida] boidinii]|nr:hypothetical protein BVG19_g459 [[Candida] boidinii]OWB50252.1 hypothetical protein B5S27_g1800 [[Candida] boidinii]
MDVTQRLRFAGSVCPHSGDHLIDINEVLTKKTISKLPASQRNPFKSGKSKKTTAKTTSTGVNNNNNKKKKLNSKDCKRILNQKKKEILHVAKYLIADKIPKCYDNLYSIIELGQYITLGFALIGLVSKIYYILQRIEGLDTVDKKKRLPIKDKTKNKIDDALSEEVGEMITILDNDDDDDAPVLEKQENQKVSKISKGRKKQKEKNTKEETKGSFLDDLFGNTSATSSSSKKRKRSKEDSGADSETNTKKPKDKKSKKKKSSSAGSYMDSLFD